MYEPSVNSTIAILEWVDVYKPKSSCSGGDYRVQTSAERTFAIASQTRHKDLKILPTRADVLRYRFTCKPVMKNPQIHLLFVDRGLRSVGLR